MGGFVHTGESPLVTTQAGRDTALFVKYIKYRLHEENKDWICCIVGPTGCLRKGTKVRTPFGNVPIEDVTDVIAVADSGVTCRSAAIVIDSGKKQLYTIRYSTGAVTCTADHKWFVYRQGMIVESRTDELRFSDELLLVGVGEHDTSLRDSWMNFKRYARNDFYDYASVDIVRHTEPIMSIDKVGIGQTYDLIVPDHHNFVLADGIITHNSGKSFSSLSIASQIDPTFEPEHDVIFDVMEILALMKSDPPKFKAYVIEEVGISLDAAKWQSKVNRAMAHLFQTVRHRNLVFILNVPSLSFLQKTNRLLLHGVLETMKIDKKKQQVVIKPFLLKWTTYKDEPYKQYLRAVDGRGSTFPVERWRVDKPSQEIIDKYEKKKKEFTTKLYTRLYNEFNEDEKELNADKNAGNAICPKCLYQWKPRSEFVSACPKCHCIKTGWLKDYKPVIEPIEQVKPVLVLEKDVVLA